MFQFVVVSRRIGGLFSRGGTGGCGRGAPNYWWSKTRTIGDPLLSRKQAGEMLFPVLHHLGEKYWRFIPILEKL